MTKKILVVENEPALRRIHRRELGKIGYQVVEAEDSYHAQNMILQDAEIAGIVLDNNMKIKNEGYNFFVRLRESGDERLNAIPVVFCVTAFPYTEEAEKLGATVVDKIEAWMPGVYPTVMRGAFGSPVIEEGVS